MYLLSKWVWPLTLAFPAAGLMFMGVSRGWSLALIGIPAFFLLVRHQENIATGNTRANRPKTEAQRQAELRRRVKKFKRAMRDTGINL